MNSVEYLTAAGQLSFTAPAPQGLPVWENPFPEQSSRLVFRLKYWQRADSWVPVTLNTAFDYPGTTSLYVPSVASASFYLVAEDNFQDQRGGVLVWDRTYAQVPAVRYDYTTMAYQFPAVLGSLSLGAYSAVTYVSDIGGGRMFIQYTGAAPGNQVALSYLVNPPGVVNRVNAAPVFDYATSGIVVAMDAAFLATTYTRWVAAAVYTAGRQFPLALAARAVVSFGYFLATPGPTFAVTPQGRQKWLLNGEEVDYLSLNTTPTSLSYLAMVTANSYFVAEDEQISRWMGNIYERKVTYVYAQ